MTQRYLRHKTTGVLYAYQDVYAQRPDFEEVIDVESRVIEDTPAPKKPRAKKPESLEAALDAATEE